MSPLPIGSPVNISVVVQTVKRTDQRMGQALDTGYACAQKLGFLDFKSDRKVVFGTDVGTFYHVSVTNKGLDNGWVVNEDLYGYRQGYVMPLYKKNAVRVTGIKELNSSTAEAYIDTGMTEILPAGSCVYPDIESQRNSASGKHKVTLGLYDDGWRVEKAQAEGARKDWVDIKPASNMKISRVASSSSRSKSADSVNRSSGTETSNTPAGSSTNNPSTLGQGDVVLVQQKLNELGYDAGVADGIAGKRTISAISAYQRDQGIPVDGQPTPELLAMLNGVSGDQAGQTVGNPVEELGNIFKGFLNKALGGGQSQ
jgi:hypothetical protein